MKRGSWLRRLAGLLGPLLIRALASWVSMPTFRIGAEGKLEALPLEARVPGAIYAFWHGRQLPLLCWRFPRGLAVMVSHSKDGSLQAQVLERLGFRVVRGSSTRGSLSATREMLRHLRKGSGAAVAVDGGRGPLHEVHEGVLMLAALSGRPIVPVGASVRRRIVLRRTWDRYLIPWPFNRGACVLGVPIFVPRDFVDALAAAPSLRQAEKTPASRLAGAHASERALETHRLRGQWAVRLGEAIHALDQAADAHCGAPEEPAARGEAPCKVCAALHQDPLLR